MKEGTKLRAGKENRETTEAWEECRQFVDEYCIKLDLRYAELLLMNKS